MKLSRAGVAALCAALLLGMTVAVTSPVGAAAGLNVNKIWKQIKPKADKRYYKKKVANKKFATQAALGAGLGNVYTKAEADAAFAKKGDAYTKGEADAAFAKTGEAYTKAESDAKYAPYGPVLRGSWMILAAGGAGATDTAQISFGQGFSVAPTVRYISIGEALPAGCSGTAAAPNADPGFLCVFESYNSEASAPSMCRAVPVQCGAEIADAFGTTIYAFASGSTMEVNGTWAARPVALASPTLKGGATPRKASGGRVPALR